MAEWSQWAPGRYGAYQTQGRALPVPAELQEMLNSCPSSTHLWPAKSNRILKMKHLPQFPFILAVYCFCLLQNPSSGYPPHSDGSPDGLDAVQLEQLAYWATVSRQPKVYQDMYKQFLFHYSRTPKPTHAVKTGDAGAVALDFIKKVCKLCGEHKPPKTTCERTGKYLELRHRAASLDDFWKELVSQYAPGNLL
ncbi:neuromedin-S [Molossus molossus]|uniref:neuromedin-S n=1 Tax=Molossus molossus TaxID=27622 RepID=UPI001746D82C|nr:neuromedin-S [Molossus molossus]